MAKSGWIVDVFSGWLHARDKQSGVAFCVPVDLVLDALREEAYPCYTPEHPVVRVETHDAYFPSVDAAGGAR